MRMKIPSIIIATLFSGLCLAQGLELDQDVSELNILAESSGEELPNDSPQGLRLTNNDQVTVDCWLQAHGPQDAEQEHHILTPGQSVLLRMPGKAAGAATQAKLVCRKH
ncbi:hypothetical protein IQ22_01601 [Pseudomonas duriflava]|uniref:Uncharacterized protein n=1 Tax=Pseudomonas duriflava TaxID=459528 RepID=A0A562QFY4_9PSED|nr:hypothetical protein [Pseudomonas duriflava]TWI55672.1 hypothetical protein IQ22_01601 [Pseudomonas duriflava]